MPETQNLSNCETRRSQKNLTVCLFGNIGNMFIDFTLFEFSGKDLPLIMFSEPKKMSTAYEHLYLFTKTN